MTAMMKMTSEGLQQYCRELNMIYLVSHSNEQSSIQHLYVLSSVFSTD